MDPASFRRHGHDLVDWIAEYLEHSEKYPVLSRVKPGEIAAALPTHAPEESEAFDAIMADFERVLVPGLTHWNHPGFLAYFAITGSAPGVLADFLSAALNQQAMLWRTSPAATELEAVALGWLRQLIGLPDTFEGVIYDTASVASMHALAAAREVSVADVRARGLAGRADLPRIRVYCSDQAHSSIDKAVMTIGLGHESLRKIDVDAEYRMRADGLSDAIVEDRRAGFLPIAVVATVGTTSTTSVDLVPAIAQTSRRDRRRREYGHAMEASPRRRRTPRRRAARGPPARRRSFGARAIREHLREHIRPAQELAARIDAHQDFTLMAPVPFSVVCFRWTPAGLALSEEALDAANERLINLVNQAGDVFLSHTRLRGRFVLRIAIGHLETTDRHVRRAWDLLVEHAAALA